MEFNIKEEQIGGVIVLNISGGLDAGTAPLLDRQIKQKLVAGIKLVIAMSGLVLISSAGWSIFIETAVQCKEKGGDIRLAGMNSDAAKIFRIMGMDKIIKSYAAKDEAVSSF